MKELMKGLFLLVGIGSVIVLVYLSFIHKAEVPIYAWGILAGYIIAIVVGPENFTTIITYFIDKKLGNDKK